MLTPWHETEYRLKFDVSDRTLAARRLRVLACELGIGETLGTQWTPDAAALPRGLQGYMIRSLPMAGDAPALPRHDGFVSYLQSRYRRFYIDFDGDFEAYKQKFSAKTRSTFARKVRRLAEVCKGTDFRLYRTAAELEAFHGLARQVSQSTYQERLFDAGLPETDDFKAHMRSAAEAGRVRAYLLSCGGTPIAYLYLEALGDTLLYRYLGFDPAYAEHSAGTVLHWLALEQLFGERAFARLDFTEGEGTQKQQFGTGSVECANVLLLRDTLAHRTLLAVHAATTRAVESAGALLDRWNLRPRIKRLLRYRWAKPSAAGRQ